MQLSDGVMTLELCQTLNVLHFDSSDTVYGGHTTEPITEGWAVGVLMYYPTNNAIWSVIVGVGENRSHPRPPFSSTMHVVLEFAVINI